MLGLGAIIQRVEGDYERCVEVSKAYAEEHELYDANPGGTNAMLQLFAYESIAYEIYDDLRDAPWAVAVPVSNGTTLAGIYKGFVSLYRRGKTSRIPRMIAGSSTHKNPIVQAVLNGLDTCRDLVPDRLRETKINEPLINWHSSEGNQALSAIRSSEGWARNASDKSMTSLSKTVREKEGLNVLPASTAGLTALLDRHRKDPLPRDRYVVVLTGRR
jgi:threonine synthase